MVPGLPTVRLKLMIKFSFFNIIKIGRNEYHRLNFNPILHLRFYLRIILPHILFGRRLIFRVQNSSRGTTKQLAVVN